MDNRVGDGRNGLAVRRAHAKLNLALAVGPTDPAKGLHPIASWFACIGLCDEIEVRKMGEVGSGVDSEARVVRSADGPCRVGLGESGDVDWRVESDLAVHAHRAVETYIGALLPAKIEVRKRIPAGGGLGGGSSDAAAVLIALNDVFQLGLDDAALAKIGAQLGSDVPFFVDRGGGNSIELVAPRPALVEGFGEKIERIGRVGGGVVLIVPAFGCPTGPVYKAFDAVGSARLDSDRVRRAASTAMERGVVDDGLLFNDLAAAAIAVRPELGELQTMVSAEIDMRVHITGSGSTLFVLCANTRDADALAVHVRSVIESAEAPAWARQCAVVPTVLV